MKIQTQKNPLTLGDYVMRVYDTHDAQRAAEIVCAAMQTQQIVLQEQAARVSRDVLKKRAGILLRRSNPG